MATEVVLQNVGNYPVVAKPRFVFVNTDASNATITTAGWLNSVTNQNIQATDIIVTNFASNAKALYTPSIDSAGVITLSAVSNPGEVSLVGSAVVGNFVSFESTTGDIEDLGYLPSDATKTTVVMANGAVVSNRFAKFTDTAGTVDDATSAGTNLGDIYAGADAVAGAFRSYSATTATGYFGWTGVANSGAYSVVVSNVAFGQSSVISIPDPANALGRLLVGATATPFTSGNFPVASGTGGLMVDSGLAASSIQNKGNIKAATTGNIGGAGAGPISVAVTGATAASVVVGTIESSSNAVQVQTITATATGFDVVFSADPGASCLLNYVLFIAAQ